MSSTEKRSANSAERHPITETEFLRRFDLFQPPDHHSIARRLIRWCEANDLDLGFMRGQGETSFIPKLQSRGQDYWPIALWASGVVRVQMKYLTDRPPFDDERMGDELFKRLQTLPGLIAAAKARIGYPNIPVSELKSPQALRRFEDFLTELIGDLGSSGRGTRSMTELGVPES